MLENKISHCGIHYSRYIASWKQSGGKLYRGGLFERWLREKCSLTEEEIREVLNLVSNGKMELEFSAEKFIEENNKADQEEKEVAEIGGYFDECTGTHFNVLKSILEKRTYKK